MKTSNNNLKKLPSSVFYIPLPSVDGAVFVYCVHVMRQLLSLSLLP